MLPVMGGASRLGGRDGSPRLSETIWKAGAAIWHSRQAASVAVSYGPDRGGCRSSRLTTEPILPSANLTRC